MDEIRLLEERIRLMERHYYEKFERAESTAEDLLVMAEGIITQQRKLIKLYREKFMEAEHD